MIGGVTEVLKPEITHMSAKIRGRLRRPELASESGLGRAGFSVPLALAHEHRALTSGAGFPAVAIFEQPAFGMRPERS
jgi:hypothetical protein